MARNALNPQALGLAIRLRREEKGYSRPELAEGAAVSYPYVYEVERGKKVPSSAVLEKLAGYLDISPGDLERRATELTREQRTRDAAIGDRLQDARTVGGNTAIGPVAAESGADDLVDRLTSAVIARIEPIVREAVASAVEVQR